MDIPRETRDTLQRQLFDALSQLRKDCGTPPEYLSIKKARHEYKFIGLRAHFILRAIREIGTGVHHFFRIKFNNSKRFEYEIWRSSLIKETDKAVASNQ